MLLLEVKLERKKNIVCVQKGSRNPKNLLKQRLEDVNWFALCLQGYNLYLVTLHQLSFPQANHLS